MSEISAIATFLQGGTITGWSLVIIGLVGVWKVTSIVPTMIEAWEKRSSGIESRLQAAMSITLDRYEIDLKRLSDRLTESDRRHKDCEERSLLQTDRINHLEKEIIGFQRQIAAQDIAAAGHLNLNATPATKAMVEKMKVVK